MYIERVNPCFFVSLQKIIQNKEKIKNYIMKRVLGLDLGTNSIGWALVNEADPKNVHEASSIIKLGVRVNPLTVDEQTNFEKGKPISTNTERMLKRSARRNLQRYKLRRKALIEVLIKNGLITENTALTEIGKNSTHETLLLRAKAAKEKIELYEFARILLSINKKRGYKSSRKAKNEEEGQAIDGMAVAKKLYDESLTPGQYVYHILQKGKKYIPDFYRSDLLSEMKKIWKFQKHFYPDILANTLFDEIQHKNKGQTWKILEVPFNIVGIKQVGNRDEQHLERYKWRSQALTKQLDLEHLAIVLQEINGNLEKSSGYLGAISDRSKNLYFNKITVGGYLYSQINENPHTSLKNQVFYRQDYLDEFEQLWETQAKFYPELLTNELKEEIRDIIIFYQRKLKSQKGLIGFCQFESRQQEYIDKETKKKKTRTIGQRVIPKSSPLFQEFKIWQNINHLEFENKIKHEKIIVCKLEDEIRNAIFEELNIRENLSAKDVLKVIARFLYIDKITDWKCNFEKIEGNKTNQLLYNVYQKIAEIEGYGFDWAKKSAREIKEELAAIFPTIGIDAEILNFDANKDGTDFDKQPAYQLWHLLYSAEQDNKIVEEDYLVYGNSDVALRKKLHQKYGFKPEYAIMLSNISLQQDYGSLSSKAIRKIIPFLQAGHPYAKKDADKIEIGAAALAGYNHSNIETVEDLDKKLYKNKLDLLPRNSLRNPVVEKILNQMVNLVNQIIDEYGKPQEIRIELARELKKTAKERAKMNKDISDATKRNEDIKNLIIREFGIPNPTKTDIVRYRLWDELKDRGYKTIFTNRYIPREKLFSKEIDIEHIIPKALLFDDSFSNKTLAYKTEENLRKSNRTAFDFISQDFNTSVENYETNVEAWFLGGKGAISKAKRNKLLMTLKDIPDRFIERDLRNSQYIVRKARQMLLEVVPFVIPTTGNITDALRTDWGLINMMKELNLPKYRALGLIKFEKRLDIGTGKMKSYEVICDWTKRNDHRHHAMDALTVAFTTHSHIQYLNNMNARRDEHHKKYRNIIAIENVITEKQSDKRVFKDPMSNFRAEARMQIENVLISFKAKNKVTTKNINKIKIKGKNKLKKKVQSTPRGQLHKETVYGKSLRPMNKPTKLNKKFTIEQANLIINSSQKELVLSHLSKYEYNLKIAFDVKTLKKDPILYREEPIKEVVCFEEIFTIRKPISANLKLDKVLDEGVRKVLQTRLDEYGGDPKKAFSNIDENPIWLNKANNIAIKRVTITGVSNAEPLHTQKDHLGEDILDERGQKQPVDFISTGNNHHVAIYEDAEGSLQENVVSFFEAVERANQGLPIIDKTFNEHLGWKFLFTMKQNEMFLFPFDDFNPSEIDIDDGSNYKLISQHLFRVQKIGTKDYTFRHHLETTVTNNLDFTYRRVSAPNNLKGVVKVRINHIGKIVQKGEY